MTPERATVLREFLRDAGWDDRPCSPLAGDASPRRYYRLDSGAGTPLGGAVLMDDPAGGAAACGRFAALSEHLTGLGIRAPRVLNWKLDQGLLLLEDLGEDLLAALLERTPDAESTCYEAAVDLLVELRHHAPPVSLRFEGAVHRIEPYDMGPLLAEAALFAEWWLPGAGGAADSSAVEEYLALIRETLADVSPSRDVLVLRDFHAENLLWLDGTEGKSWQRVGVLDYQDALAGHAAYDLVSLLEDARRDTTPALRDAMHAHYASRAGLSRDERSEFAGACAALAAQRNLKIIGVFARLCIRDGKPAYLDLVPRVWNHLLRDLTHPRLKALERWIRNYAPEPNSEVRAGLRDGCNS